MKSLLLLLLLLFTLLLLLLLFFSAKIYSVTGVNINYEIKAYLVKIISFKEVI